MRLSPERVCDGCGRGGAMTRVKVKPIVESAPAIGEIGLCSDCRQKPWAAWRLRWAEVNEMEVDCV